MATEDTRRDLPGGEGRPRRAAAPKIGDVLCGLASEEAARAAHLPTVPDKYRYLTVSIPVNVNRVVGVEVGEVVLRVALKAPPGQPHPVGWAAEPSVAYRTVTHTRTHHVKVAPKILDTGFERMTETSSEELVTDFSGAGSSSIRWTISNKQREIAGSYNFNFIARVPISTYGWIEAKADLRLRHRWYRRHQEQPAPAFRNAPLIDPSDPQAGATLTLEETVKSERQTIFVGRPQALAITQGPGGVIVGSPGSVPELAAGLLQWSWSTGDDIPHTPGYLWAQRSPNSVFFASDPESPLIPGIRTVVKSGDMLQLGVGIRLRVKYGEPDSPPEMTLSAALQINVIVDGAIRAKHDAHSDYVTVGRTDRDVIIFRPEISAAHGHFQLAKGGWAYHHESRTRPIAELVRAGTTERDIHLGESAQLVSGDVISLSERVSLEVIITH